MVFYINFVNGNTPYFYAGYHLFYQVGEKTLYTNHGINFFLYVISGQKFRTDLLTLFKCSRNKPIHLKYVTNSVTHVSTLDAQMSLVMVTEVPSDQHCHPWYSRVFTDISSRIACSATKCSSLWCTDFSFIHKHRNIRIQYHVSIY